MLRFLRLVLTFWLIMAAFVEVSAIIGQRQPVPNRLARLYLTDCAPPCWIGIIPGVTRLRDANARLIAVYGKSLALFDNGLPAYLKDETDAAYIPVSFATLDNKADILR